MGLKSRDRVILALRHEEPDRIPIDLGATPCTSVHVKAYYDLRKYLGLSLKPVRVMSVGMQVTEVDRDILDLFHVDVIDINRTLDPAAPYPYTFKFASVVDGSLKEVSDRESTHSRFRNRMVHKKKINKQKFLIQLLLYFPHLLGLHLKI